MRLQKYANQLPNTALHINQLQRLLQYEIFIFVYICIHICDHFRLFAAIQENKTTGRYHFIIP